MLLKSFIVFAAILSLAFTSGGGKKERATFKVYGECGMCEKRIEKALNETEGIVWADWELTTLELTVKYDTEVITLDQIKKKVAEIGHDTDEERATQEAYENLHACCKYERPKN